MVGDAPPLMPSGRAIGPRLLLRLGGLLAPRPGLGLGPLSVLGGNPRRPLALPVHPPWVSLSQANVAPHLR